MDSYLTQNVRSYLEDNYYSKINQHARLEAVFKDIPGHQENTIAWFADHGVVHLWDVARQVPVVIDRILGTLIPARAPHRVEQFMKGYGVIMAYFHDIGLVDFSRFGRRMHPEYASQALFSPEFDPLVEEVWSENCGSIAGRLLDLRQAGLLQHLPLQIVLRELFALSLAHSKSKVNGNLLNDREALRRRMLTVLETDLETLYQRPAREDFEADGQEHLPSPARQVVLSRYYQDFRSQAYTWLISDHPLLQDLVQDVTDTLRALRCSDALRQRGTTLKTSGGYEVFASRSSGNAVLALRSEKGALYFVEVEDPVSAGEANIASSEITPSGDLRLSFHLGSFTNPRAFENAVQAAALVVDDLQADILGSFNPLESHLPGRRLPGRLQPRILLENLEDAPQFVDCVIDALRKLNPVAAARVEKVASLQSASGFERDRYLQAATLDWDPQRYASVLEQVYRTGQKPLEIDPQLAFHQVKWIRLQASELLVEAGTPSGFVYLPLGDGLKVLPLGGYAAFAAQAWMPMGATGVIRGAVRNARVVADQEVELLVIPKEVFLEYWYKPYSMEDLKQVLIPGQSTGEG